MRNRHRWWYRMTGLPGWMRFGFSPGWLGFNPHGFNPATHAMMHGTWPTPQMNTNWQQGQVPPRTQNPRASGFETLYDPYGAAEITPEQELDILKGQADMLEDELEGIKKQIHELEQTNV